MHDYCGTEIHKYTYIYYGHVHIYIHTYIHACMHAYIERLSEKLFDATRRFVELPMEKHRPKFGTLDTGPSS